MDEVGARRGVGVGRWLLGAVLASVPGCYLEYETVDEACPDRVPGQRFLADDLDGDLVWRMSCYRRFVGLSSLPVRSPIQNAVDAHVSYLDQNQILIRGSRNEAQTVEDVFIEDPTLAFFTGRDGYDRLKVAEAIDPTASTLLWEFLAGQVDERRADELMTDWMVRDVVFQPYIIGVGYGELPTSYGTSAYMNLLYSLPADRRVDRPVIYPRDGQTDIPVAWVPDDELDPLRARSVVGFPISVTVGSDVLGAGANPYLLFAIEASLVDDAGNELTLVTGGPGVYASSVVQSTLAFASTRPLDPGTTYTFEADITWNSRERKHVSTSFTTAGGASDAVDTDVVDEVDADDADDVAPTSGPRASRLTPIPPLVPTLGVPE